MQPFFRRHPWLPFLAAVLAVVSAALWIAFHRLTSNARQAAIDWLEERFERDVELESLSLGLLPFARSRGRNLVVHQKSEHAHLPPFISIDAFTIDLDLFDVLIRRPIRIDRVHLEALEINVPPDDEREKDIEGKERRPPVPNFVIGRLTTSNVILNIHRREASREPLVWNIFDLALESAGTVEPMVFDATLRNATPPGLIETRGAFGPWQEDALASTPVSGRYRFEQADLSVFEDISGILSSEGVYSGVLGRLEVEGTTETPDFAIYGGGNSLPLQTEFFAIVDGTNGDTRLDPVGAVLGQTPLVARGGVIHREGPGGKSISLKVVVANGRLEDLLRLGVRSEQPLLTGRIDFSADFELPQGPGEVTEKLVIDGRFDLDARFTDPALQDRIDELSKRSRGEPEDPDPERVASNFEGAFRLRSGVVQFPDLRFRVPGAQVALEGTYGLESERIDMRGKAHIEAELAETTTGLKSFLLRLIGPFLGAASPGSDLSISITGTREKPDFELHLSGS